MLRSESSFILPVTVVWLALWTRILAICMVEVSLPTTFDAGDELDTLEIQACRLCPLLLDV